jgi:hypothetical protein
MVNGSPGKLIFQDPIYANQHRKGKSQRVWEEFYV